MILFLSGTIFGGFCVILMVAIFNVGDKDKKIEDREQEEWLRERMERKRSRKESKE